MIGVLLHLLHHLSPTGVLPWHNHFVHIKQRYPVVPVQRLQVQKNTSKVIQPYSLIVSGQENQVKIQNVHCTTNNCEALYYEILRPVHVSVEAIIVRNQFVASLLLLPPDQNQSKIDCVSLQLHCIIHFFCFRLKSIDHNLN